VQFALAVRSLVDVLDGIDISQAMLEQAQKLGIYRELIHADIGSCLKTAEGAVDLVVASSAAVCVTG
jgi:predicted TPR repeat methyltransferase